jgi:hypothetical protein
MKIIRVFPRRTSYTPTDDYVRIGHPDMFDRDMLPPHDEIHISCAFTWDRPICHILAAEWQEYTNKPVKLGGVAFGSPVEDFTQGLYLAPNIIFTSRGCNNNCPWCMVPRIEGKFRTLGDIPIGNIIQDNNFLQSNRTHMLKVFDMLRTQHTICFKGGLEPDLINEDFINNITSLRIKELWLACDNKKRLPAFKRACEKLRRAGFNREKIHCYVLSYGKNREADEARARAVWEAGAMPSVQLYRDYTDIMTQYSDDWERWARMWQRPAAIRAHMIKGTSYHDFNT